MEDSLNLRGATELSKGKGKTICVAKGKKSMLDVDLEKTVTFLREKNVGVVICDERELNQIRMHGEKAKGKPICGGKENVAPKLVQMRMINCSTKQLLSKSSGHHRRDSSKKPICIYKLTGFDLHGNACLETVALQ